MDSTQKPKETLLLAPMGKRGMSLFCSRGRKGWMTGSSPIEAMWKAYSKGIGPSAQLAFEALSCPRATCLSNVEGIVGGGPFVSHNREKSISLETCENGVLDGKRAFACQILRASKNKNKSNARKRSGDNENAILWTPLLTPFAQTDMLGPKGLGFLLYGERVERNLMGRILVQRMVLVGTSLVGSLLFNLDGL